MTDYEKGTPAWDIGQLLTRHASLAHGDRSNCARVTALLETRRENASRRLAAALAQACNCGKGDCTSERTSLRPSTKIGAPQ